jgi:hypothetical protein
MAPNDPSVPDMPPNPYATRAVSASESGNAAFVALLDARGQPAQYAEVSSDGVTIGRLRSSDLVLDDPTISRNHARVEWDGRHARVTDLGSKLGTFLGAVRLMPQTAYEWPPEQPLRIGRYVFRLYPGALPPAAGSAPPASPVAGSGRPESMAGVSSAVAAAAPTGRLLPPEPLQGVAEPAPAPIALSIAPEQVALTLVPGERASVNVRVRNNTTLPLTISLTIDGFPSEWVDGMPTLSVAPGAQASATLTVSVPAASASLAGVRPVSIQAFAAELPTLMFEAPLEWHIAPFLSGELTITPKRASGRDQAVYTIQVRNNGNVHAAYVLSAAGEPQELEYSFAQERMSAAPGAIAETSLTVIARRHMFGADRRHTFTVQAVETDVQQSMRDILSAQALFVQTATFPLWFVPLIIGLLLFGTLCGFAVLPASLAGALPGYGIFAAPTEPLPDTRGTAVAQATATAQQLQLTEQQGLATIAALEQTATAASADQRVEFQATLVAQFATATAIAIQFTALPTLPPPTDAPFATVPPGTLPAPTATRPAVAASATATPTRTPSRTPAPSQTPAPGLPQATIEDATVQRLTNGETSLIFRVRLSNASASIVSIAYTTEDDTARAGVDYRSVNGTLTFNPGDLEREIAVPVLPDAATAIDLRLRVVLTSAAGANLARGIAVGTIRPAAGIATATFTPTPTPSATPTRTPSPAPTNTLTPVPPTPTNTFTPVPSATPTNTFTPVPSATPTNTFTPVPSATPTNTFTPVPPATPTETPTPTPTETLTPTPTETPEPVNLTLTAPSSVTVTGGAAAPWTDIAGVEIGGVPDSDAVTVTLSIAGVTPSNNAGQMRIAGTGGFGLTAAPQTFTTTRADANDRLTRLQYRRGEAGIARMTITVVHGSGQSRTVQIDLIISVP